MNILIIRFSSIGDIVLATPVIRCVKQQLPGATVHFLIKKNFKAVLEANPYIDHFHYYDKSFDEMLASLKGVQFDYVIDLHKNLRTLRLKRHIKATWLAYNKESVEKFLLTKFHINRMAGRHITDRSLDTVASLGVVNDGAGLDYFIPEGKGIQLAQLPESHRPGFIAIVIGASYYTKKLPVEKLVELCQQIGRPIILVGGKEDKDEGDAVARHNPANIFNACGLFTLHQSADIVRLAEVVISHDTGLQYIACAFNKKVIAIWGGTSPLLDVEPYYGAKQLEAHNGAAYQNFIVPNLPCQPCSNFGTPKCPKGHFNCMRLQKTGEMAGLSTKWASQL